MLSTLPFRYFILIVDDSEVDRATYRRYLEACDYLGCEIIDCETAESALHVCQSNCPDLILLDYLLPDTDGLELLQDFRQYMNPLPPVIMLTGQGNEAVAVTAMKQGARDYLIKGQLTPQYLVSSVLNALSATNLQRQIDHQRQQQELLSNITLQVSNTVELSQLIEVAVEGARKLLNCDRTLVYRFKADMRGRVIAESVLPQWSKTLANQVEDNCFQGKYSYSLQQFLQGYRSVVTDVRAANLTACHVEMLEQYQVKSVIAVPILFRDMAPDNELSLWGLLIAHHCQTIHEWTTDELNLLDELSRQMVIAIQQAELMSDLRISLREQQAIEEQLRQRMVEIEQANLQLSQTTNLLQKRNQELDEFSYVASHDLQAPLRGIANLTQWLSEDLSGNLLPENQAQLDLINSRVLQMSALIDGLLHYARAGKEQVELVVVPLSQLLTEVVDLLMPPPDFQVQFSDQLPIVKTPVLLLKQVFANLIGNAIKYHERTDGKVEILVKEQSTQWQFTVVDDGPGIDPAQHERIFGIFQTLKTQNDKKGTGIGLAIVKKIVERQGGSVWLESELGKGSAFSFTWPKLSNAALV